MMIPIEVFCNGDLSLFANCLSVARLTLCEYFVRAARQRPRPPLPATAPAGSPSTMDHTSGASGGPATQPEQPHAHEGEHARMEGHAGHSMPSNCPMHMWFFSSTCVIEMFSGQVIDDLPLFIGYLGAIVIAMILYEILKLHRDVIFQKAIVPLEAREASSWITWYHFYQTLLHALQLFSSYLFMLLFMTFNVWICLAVVLGVAIGYFLVGWRKTEHTLSKVTDDCCY